MPQIEILSEKLCNQIAAGEVVERPASVIKELLENSLDAQADKIVIEIENGGKKKILVSDNGHGMGRDDVFLCFERHATSKIKTENDLFHLQYHGFRGEALPSIAAVSRLTVTSRIAEDPVGMRVNVNGGKIDEVTEVGVPTGTTFEVRDLFYNLPARKKFLRRDETEFGHIAEVVSRLSLAHVGVHFKLVHNGKVILDLYRQRDCLDRVAAVLGRNVVSDLREVDCQEQSMGLTGYVALATVNRSTTAGIYCFVNGRFIKDRVLHHAIMDGYRQLIMKGRYPVCILFLTLNSEDVDVNVHPTKHEVRFHNQKNIHTFVSNVVRDTLHAAYSAEMNSDQQRSHNVASNIGGKNTAIILSSCRPMFTNDVANCGDEPAGVQERYSGGGQNSVLLGSDNISSVREDDGEYALSDTESNVALPRLDNNCGYFAALTIIGQFHRSYVVCEDADGLILLDQHAAHERIGFERLKKQYLLGDIEQQELLFPVVLELGLRQDTELKEHLDGVQQLGFVLEPFGGYSWALKSIPAFLSNNDAGQMVLDVLAELSILGSAASSRDAYDAILIKMACHGMIRANQKLAVVEMEALLQQLDEVDFNRHCPHGRPILQRLSLVEIEKMFRRQ